MASTDDKEPQTVAALSTINLLSGACLGGLVGIMLGMSVSETVSGVLMALTALLGAFFGLSDVGVKSDNPLRHYRIIGFSVLCITGLIMGVGIRTSNAFAPSPEKEIARWEKIVGKSKAIDIVTARHFGLNGASLGQQNDGSNVSKQNLVHSSVLFSSQLDDTCGRVDSDIYTDGTVLAAALKQESDARWQQLANKIPPGPGQLIGLQAAIQLVCRK